MNIPNARKLIAAIQESQTFNMANWGYDRDGFNVVDANLCETPGCAAGHAVTCMTDKERAKTGHFHIRSVAAAWLEFTVDQTMDLFQGYAWPGSLMDITKAQVIEWLENEIKKEEANG